VIFYVRQPVRYQQPRGRLTAQQAQKMVEQLALLPIEIDPTSARPGFLLSLALRFDLSAYDAALAEAIHIAGAGTLD